MYSPKFSITNEILKNVGAIEASREVIENAPLIPAYERKFREDAILRTVHFGTHLEGNDLTLTQAKDILSGESIVARDRDIQEVINYRNVIAYIDSLAKGDGNSTYNQEILSKIHKLTVEKILQDGNAGKFRESQVVVKDAKSGDVTFRPPPAVEVPYLLSNFFDWLNSARGGIHSVLRAGITHYVLVAIHPFVEGNGRTARAFATVVLFNEGYDIKRIFSLEEYFDRDVGAYYEALRLVSNQAPNLEDRDLTPWLEYFTKGLAIELEKVKDQVKKLSMDLRLKSKIGGKQVQLSERQIKLMEYLSEHGSFKMAEAKRALPMVSDDTVLRDLRDLIKKDIITRSGKTKGVEYVLKAR